MFQEPYSTDILDLGTPSEGPVVRVQTKLHWLPPSPLYISSSVNPNDYIAFIKPSPLPYYAMPTVLVKPSYYAQYYACSPDFVMYTDAQYVWQCLILILMVLYIMEPIQPNEPRYDRAQCSILEKSDLVLV